MSAARKCDRCGQFFELPKAKELGGFRWHFGPFQELAQSIDLCADCCDKLSEWIEGERETLTEQPAEVVEDTRSAFERMTPEEYAKYLQDAQPKAEGFVSLLEETEPEQPEQPVEAPQSDSDDVPEETGEVVTSKPDAPTRGNRGREITKDYLSGMKRKAIAEKYELAPKSVSNAIAYFKANHPEEYAEMVKSAKNR